MKEKMIAEITPYVFNDFLIITFSKDWLQVFKKIPTFQVTIDKRRLQITSEEIPIGDKNE